MIPASGLAPIENLAHDLAPSCLRLPSASIIKTNAPARPGDNARSLLLSGTPEPALRNCYFRRNRLA